MLFLLKKPRPFKKPYSKKTGEEKAWLDFFYSSLK